MKAIVAFVYAYGDNITIPDEAWNKSLCERPQYFPSGTQRVSRIPVSKWSGIFIQLFNLIHVLDEA